MQADLETPPQPDAPASPALSSAHRLGAVAALVGGLFCALTTLLTWGNDAGLLSGWARFDDNDLSGAHSGFDATGGSWFGILFGLVGLAVAYSGASALWHPRSRARFIAAAGAFLTAGLVLVSLIVAYLSVSARGQNYSHGTGA